MEHYCAYLRKSREDRDAEARGEGETLARHKKILEDLSERMRLPIERFYSEVVSGDTIAARPAMQELLQDVESGRWDGVFVVEVERLARGDSIDQGIVSRTFQLTDTKIITPIKTYDPANEYDSEFFEFSLFMSRREYKTINRRLQAGRVASVKEGNYIGSADPYGYRKVRLTTAKGYTLEVLPEEADAVRSIFQWFCVGDENGHTLSRIGIANKLNDMRIPTKHGKKWTYSSVEGVLSNPLYIGYVRWNSRPVTKGMKDGKVSTSRKRNEDCMLVKGRHPAIISREIYDMAQKIRESHANPTWSARVRILSNPFSGLIVCGICGHKMQFRLKSNGSPRDTILCTYGCGCKGSYFDDVEKAILDGLKEIMESYKIQLSDPYPAAASDDTLQRIKKLTAEKASEKKKLDQIFDFLESGIYSVEVFTQRKAVIDDRIRDIDHTLQELQEEHDNAEASRKAIERFIPKVENLLSSYYTLSAAEKNSVLSEVIDHCTYYKTARGQRGKGSAPFRLDIFPRLPL